MASSGCAAERIDAYVQVATKVTADRHGQKTIAPGDRMIVDPDTHECMPDTPANRRAFERNGMSFYLKPDADMRSKLNDMGNRSLSFGMALATNAESLVGAAIPNCNLPWRVNLVPFLTLKFGRCREMKVRQTEFIEHLEKRGVIPSSRDVRPDVWDAICRANLFRVYELRGWGAVFHVYAIFITHVAVGEREGARRLVVRPANGAVYDKVVEFVKTWKGRLVRANCRCLSIGSYGGWDENLDAVELPDSIQALSSPDPSDSKAWKVKLPNLEYMRPIYKKLVYGLWPVAWTAWVERVHDFLENNSFECSMTVKCVADKAHVPEYCVAEVFDYLRDRDGRWVSTRISKGELALVEANGRKSDVGAFMPSARKWPWFLLYLFLFSPLCLRWTVKSSPEQPAQVSGEEVAGGHAEIQGGRGEAVGPVSAYSDDKRSAGPVSIVRDNGRTTDSFLKKGLKMAMSLGNSLVGAILSLLIAFMRGRCERRILK